MKKPRKAIKATVKAVKDRKPIRRRIAAKLADNTELVEAVKTLHADLSIAVGQLTQLRADVRDIKKSRNQTGPRTIAVHGNRP